MIIASSPIVADVFDFFWEVEHVLQIGYDMREPYFISVGEKLYFFFFKAGTNPIEFSPDNVYRMQKEESGWSEAEPTAEPGPGLQIRQIFFILMTENRAETENFRPDGRKPNRDRKTETVSAC